MDKDVLKGIHCAQGRYTLWTGGSERYTLWTRRFLNVYIVERRLELLWKGGSETTVEKVMKGMFSIQYTLWTRRF